MACIFVVFDYHLN